MDSLPVGIVEHETAAAATVLRRWLGEDEIRANVAQWIKALLAGGVANDDGPRVVEWAGGHHAVVQFGEIADCRPRPHVAIWARSADPDSPAALQELTAAARTAFAGRACSGVWVLVHGADTPAWAVGTNPYKSIPAVAMRDVLESPAPREAERVRVETPVDLSFMAEYERMYDDFWRTSPDLRDWIGIEPREDLLAYAARGGLRTVHVDGELAGLIGGVPHAEFGLRGWRLRERVMADRFRGKGLAAAALWRFAHDLAHEPPDLLWGTAHARNHASLRSAQRVGRVVVGRMVWA